MRRRWIALAATFCLLASVASASAGCAWVLWAVSGGNAPSPGPDPVFASTTKQECERALAKRIADAKRGPGRVTVDGTTVIHWDASGSRVVWTDDYLCLPDTVDPHGPRGK